MNTIRYNLQSNPITPDPNDQSARVVHDKTRYVPDIVELMLIRGTGLSKQDMNAVLDLFFEVVANEVASSNKVITPIAKYGASITGVFTDVADSFDPARHAAGGTVSAGDLLNLKVRAASKEKILQAAPQPFILQIRDVESTTANSKLSPGGIVEISGEELKFDKTQTDEGVFLLGAADPIRIATYYKVTQGLIVFTVPATLPVGSYTLEVRRAYTNARAIRKGTSEDALLVS